MLYIKIDIDREVTLGGTVATQQMLNDGYIEFNGSVPYITEQEKIIFEDDELKVVSIFSTEQFKSNKIKELNSQRDKELKELTINDILCNDTNVFKMAVKYSLMNDGDTVNWISKSNSKVTLSKDELGSIIKQAAVKTEEIHFRFKDLKDKL